MANGQIDTKPDPLRPNVRILKKLAEMVLMGREIESCEDKELKVWLVAIGKVKLLDMPKSW